MNLPEQEPSRGKLPFIFYKLAVLLVLLSLPLGVMIFLSDTILFPALNDPESRIYFSKIGTPSRQREEGNSIPVTTVPVTSKMLEESLAAPGESVALQKVDIRPLVSGPVEKVYVVEGDVVEKGQPLIALNPIPFEDRVNKARNNLAVAEKTLQSLKTSVPERLIELENDVEIARARLEEAETRVQEINALTEREVQNNVELARMRLELAEKRLKPMEALAEEGAISRFQLYEIQDIYATRKKELVDAQQGEIANEDRRFSNKDFYLNRQNDLIAAEQELILARRNLEKQLTITQLEIDSLRIELSEELRDLNRTVIYAETDGLVTQVNIYSGEIVDASSTATLMTLAKNFVFKAFIDQVQLNAIQIGDPVTVNVLASPGQSYQGEVIRVNPTIETNAVQPLKVGVDRQYTYSVWIALDALEFPPGLQGLARFSKVTSGLVIPEIAVTHLSGGEGMVMVAESGRAVLKPITIGRKYNNLREVVAGLEEGTHVILYPKALKPGDFLNIESALNKEEVKP